MQVSERYQPDVVEAAIKELSLAPYGQRVVVLENKVPEKVGSLYIPENQKEVTATDGYVLAVGPEVTFCQPGDLVLFARYSGTRTTWCGAEYRIMNEEDLLGRLNSACEV